MRNGKFIIQGPSGSPWHTSPRIVDGVRRFGNCRAMTKGNWGFYIYNHKEPKIGVRWCL